jgi:alkyl sulfatase BDS1-like metallo-beta-lactamase superfamily hydrolase
MLTPADFADQTDFENANRGLIDAGEPVTVTAADDRVVFDLEPYTFLHGEASGYLSAGLWRQA